MSKQYKTNSRKILDAIGILTDTFTAAVTNICTQSAHGLKDGDMVVLTTTTTLPAGLALATIYYVKVINANTFYLCDREDLQTIVDITNTGTGTHTYTMHDIGVSQNIADFDSVSVRVITTGFTGNLNFLASSQDEEPDFSGTKSATNIYDAVDIVDNEDNAHVEGDAGLSFTLSTDVGEFEISISRKNWLNAIISSWSAGTITVEVTGYKYN